jgi:hypothetical protein
VPQPICFLGIAILSVCVYYKKPYTTKV